tara:strand:- start:22891 stop:23094 length:204 start_codon:yes stop_codon:yes gene_type:complete
MGIEEIITIDITINTVLFVVGVILITLTLLLILTKDFPAGTKGITDEYTSPSGKKRTAKKERKEHIV